MLAIDFAFVSAFLSAVNVVAQHVASTAAPSGVKAWRLALYLVRNPLWLLGVAATVGGFVFQALALYKGRMSVVQSILITELVFSLVIGRFWLHRKVRLAAWLSACLTAVALALFLVISEPKGGHPQATAAAWLPALLTFGGVTALCAVFGRRGSPVRRAALYAAGSGIVAALLATFLKAATDILGVHGPLAVLAHGATYGLIAAGVIGTILTQAALHYGPLAVSQSVMVISNPIVSVVMGIWLYGEHFTGGAPRLAAAAASFAAMIVGVILLARTAPSFASSKPEPQPTDVVGS
jgi:drug/metabolite transporter (DMT)-like permease